MVDGQSGGKLCRAPPGMKRRRRRNCKLAVVFHGFRERSASSEAFGPKIVSADNLPGTPMEPRSSIEDDLHSAALADGDLSNHHHHFLNGSSTKLVLKNELSERRRSLDLINRPPSPSHFIQFTGTKKIPAESPLMDRSGNTNHSPPPPLIDHHHHHLNHHQLNHQPHKPTHQGDLKPLQRAYSQDGLHNGVIEHSSSGRDKDDKEVSGDDGGGRATGI